MPTLGITSPSTLMAFLAPFNGVACADRTLCLSALYLCLNLDDGRRGSYSDFLTGSRDLEGLAGDALLFDDFLSDTPADTPRSLPPCRCKSLKETIVMRAILQNGSWFGIIFYVPLDWSMRERASKTLRLCSELPLGTELRSVFASCDG